MSSPFLGPSWKSVGGYERIPIGNYARFPYLTSETAYIDNISSGGGGGGGATGVTGPVGPQGATGAQGSQGSQGSQGPQGLQGIQGIQGAQGAQGDTGPQGIQGNQGNQGIQGDTGPQGPVGATASANLSVFSVTNSFSPVLYAMTTGNNRENLNPGQYSSASWGYYINVGNIVWFQALVGITGTAGLTSTSSVLISTPVDIISTQLYINSQTISVSMSNPVGVTNAVVNYFGGFGVNFNGNIFQVSQINNTNPSSSNPFFIYYSGFYFIKV